MHHYKLLDAVARNEEKIKELKKKKRAQLEELDKLDDWCYEIKGKIEQRKKRKRLLLQEETQSEPGYKRRASTPEPAKPRSMIREVRPSWPVLNLSQFADAPPRF